MNETAIQPTRMDRYITWQNFVLAVAFIIMLPLVYYNVSGWVKLIVFPGEANFGEGMLIFEAMRLAHGHNIYGDISKPPYWVVTYPPLFQLLVAPLAWTGMWWPRVISLLATVGQLSIIVAVCRRYTGNWLAGAVACAIWINSPCVNAWSAIGRTDTLGRFLSSACVAAALFCKSNKRATWLAIIFGTLAMLTKQNMIAGGIVAAFVLWQRQRKSSVLFAFGWVGATCLAYGLLEIISGGRFFRHIVGYTSRPLDFHAMRYWIKDFFWAIHWPYIGAAIPGIAAALFCRKDIRWLLVAILAAVPNCILTGNTGADRNYFLDMVWPISMLAGIGIWHYSGMLALQIRAAIPFAIIFAVLGLLTRATDEGFRFFRMPYPDHTERARTRKLTQVLRDIDGPILSEYIGNVLMAGKQPDYAPYIMKLVADTKQWDPTPIVQKLYEKKYGAVLTCKYAGARYPKPILDAIYANYHTMRVIEPNYLIEEPMSFNIMVPNEEAKVTSGTVTQ